MQIRNIEFLAKGKRGIVYTGEHNGKKIVIKKKRKESKAIGKIENEAKFLKILNKHKIGPKFISFDRESLVMEYIKGDKIMDYIEKENKKSIKNVLLKVFDKMFLLDKLGINKEEMHHPWKHIIVYRENPKLIDFERAHYSEKAKNVTQFVQFLRSIAKILEEKGISINRKEMIMLSKKYKSEMNKKNFAALKGQVN